MVRLFARAASLPESGKDPAHTSRAALDWLNFFLADVQGGLGPFLAIYLMYSQTGWSAGRTGVVLTIGGLATVIANSPAGALVDATNWKRALIVAAALVVAFAAALEALIPSFWPLALAQAGAGVADAIFPSAIAAISLGIVGRKLYTWRTGRNQAWNHGGNVLTALASGLAGSFVQPVLVLWLVAFLSLLSGAAALWVNGRAIDHDLARGADDGDRGKSQPNGLKVLLSIRPLLLFACAITLFHFANAAMLPLAGEKISRHHRQDSMFFMAACIIVAQFVMVGMAMLVGRRADRWGRKPIFLAGFLALPIRGLLFSVAHQPWMVISLQTLDGVGAGIFGALFPLVVADLTRGTGRYNLALGAASTCFGLGAALSNGVAGYLVDWFGYDSTFRVLAGIALCAFLMFLFLVPETNPGGPGRRSVSAPAGLPARAG